LVVRLFTPVFPPFDLRLISHGTEFLSLKHTCACAVPLLEQLKSPLFNFFKKLPIIKKIIREYLAQAYW
jgi:hypothetical protein